MRILGIGGGTTEVLTDLSARLLGFTHDRVHHERRPDRRAEYAGQPGRAAGQARHARGRAGQGGGRRREKYVDRHHARGKLLARERIELLVDPGSPFLELSPLAAWGTDYTVGASVVTGIGVVNGVECMIIANDPTVRGGASNPWTLKKTLRAQRDRAGEPAAADRAGRVRRRGSADAEGDLHPGRAVFRDLTRLSAAGIPTIALVFGNSTAGGAYVPGMSDYVVMVEDRAKVFLAGPPLVKMATGEDADDESLGGAEMHARPAGWPTTWPWTSRTRSGSAAEIVRRLNWRKHGPCRRSRSRAARCTTRRSCSASCRPTSGCRSTRAR